MSNSHTIDRLIINVTDVLFLTCNMNLSLNLETDYLLTHLYSRGGRQIQVTQSTTVVFGTV